MTKIPEAPFDRLIASLRARLAFLPEDDRARVQELAYATLRDCPGEEFAGRMTTVYAVLTAAVDQEEALRADLREAHAAIVELPTIHGIDDLPASTWDAE